MNSILQKRIVPVLTALSENTYLSAIRAGMVSVVPLTIIGGFFTILLEFPWSGWDKIVAPYHHLLQVPVTATFGLLAVFSGQHLNRQLFRLRRTQTAVRAEKERAARSELQADHRQDEDAGPEKIHAIFA